MHSNWKLSSFWGSTRVRFQAPSQSGGFRPHSDEVIFAGKVDGEADVRGVVKHMGFGSFITDLISMGSKR